MLYYFHFCKRVLKYTAVVRGKPPFFHLNFWIVCSFLFVPSLVAFIYIKSHTHHQWLTFISLVLCYCSGIYADELAGCCNVAVPKYPLILSQPVATPTQIISIAEHSSTSCFPAVSYVWHLVYPSCSKHWIWGIDYGHLMAFLLQLSFKILVSCVWKPV
jgi:hypothetical protein